MCKIKCFVHVVMLTALLMLLSCDMFTALSYIKHEMLDEWQGMPCLDVYQDVWMSCLDVCLGMNGYMLLMIDS